MAKNFCVGAAAASPFDAILAGIAGITFPPVGEVYRSRGKCISSFMLDTIKAYVERGERPGGFLQAVICNDLAEAVARADSGNLDNLAAFVDYFYNEVPSPAWRSKAKMEAWIAKFEPEPTEEQLIDYDLARLQSVIDGSLLRKLDGIALARQIQQMGTAL